jgi:hypothetical protein
LEYVPSYVAATGGTSFIKFEESGMLKFSWVTDYVGQETSVQITLNANLITEWGDTLENYVFVTFTLLLELPACSETVEDITLAIGQAISEQFYMFGDGEKVIQVSEFQEISATSCTEEDIKYEYSVVPNTSGQSWSFIQFDEASLKVSVATSEPSDSGSFTVKITGEI